MHGCFCVSVGLCVQHTLHLGIREWWAIESIRHVISKAVHLSIWVSEILRGKCRVCIPPWEPRVLQLLMLAFLGLFNVHTREELMQKKKKKPKQSRFSFISLSFFLHLLYIAHNLAQSLLLCSIPLPVRLSSLAYTTPPLPVEHFIMQLLNILQPIVPKELVCYNMKIWPHLAEVMGNKHLTRGWADRASNSNFLLASCWFAVLPGSACFPLPVVSSSQKSVEHFISRPVPPSLSIQIYWYWPFAEIKRVDPWAARAKFKPIKEHFTNQQVKARSVSQAGLVKLILICTVSKPVHRSNTA